LNHKSDEPENRDAEEGGEPELKHLLYWLLSPEPYSERNEKSCGS